MRCSERCYCFFSLAAVLPLFLSFITSQWVGNQEAVVHSLVDSASSVTMYSPSCGMSIFVAGVAFTPRPASWPGVSRAYPIVDEDSFGFGGL